MNKKYFCICSGYMNKGNWTATTIIIHIILYLGVHVLYTKKLLKLENSVKITHDHVQRKIWIAFTIPQSLQCSYDANFKSMVRNPNHQSVTKVNVETKTTIIKGNKFNLKSILWAQLKEFQCQWQNVSMLVLEECKNGLLINRETIQIIALESAVSLMILR